MTDALGAGTKAVELDPGDNEAHNSLGAILQDLGRFEEAEASYKQTIALKSDYAEAHSNLGITLQELGRLEEAEASYRQAIALEPNYAEAHSNLGATLQVVGRLEEAEASYTQAISLKPDFADAHYNLGNILQGMGKLEEAEASCRQAIALKYDYAEAHNNLGITLQELGRLVEAEASCRQAIALKPNYAEAHSNLGVTLQELGRLEEAEASCRQAIALKSDFAEAHYNLGVTLKELGRLDEAEASYRQTISLKPDFVEGHNNLGNILQGLGRLEEAQASFTQAISLKPDYAEAHSNLGVTLKDLGRLEEAEASYTQAIVLKPDYAEAHSNRLFLIASMHFQPALYQKYSRDFSNMVRKRVDKQFVDWPSAKEFERLRIGFVSGDFKSHPVGHFLEGLLIQLQSSSCDLFAYPTVDFEDQITGRLKHLFHAWHPLVDLSDEQAAQRIHNDNIHILIDLSGHTAHNRLPVFAWKPAPVQVTWLGYFASTGLSEMDYLLGDPFVTPKAEADHFIEEIWRLPESYLCFTPPKIDVAVGPLPAFSNGFITFGCFNKLSRMTDEVVATRAKILRAVPASKLFLKDKQLEYKSICDRVIARFRAYGISADRLILEGRESRERYLACYNRVDVALSPFPYGGGTTSVEGLWMGVPVITKMGNYFLSHLGESIAHNSGLSDWVATDKSDYIAKAINFSSDLEALDTLRKGLRERLLQTPLCDARSFASDVETAYQDMWRKYLK
jgi:predicted O-linked N-acetylglucosamine transferase (SPINDLY family)